MKQNSSPLRIPRILCVFIKFLSNSIRVKDLAFAYQEHHRRNAVHREHHHSGEDSGRDSQDILYPLEEADVVEGQRLTDADGQVTSSVKESESSEDMVPPLRIKVGCV